MKQQELLALAEKYERWAKQDDMPAPLVREYQICAQGLRLLANAPQPPRC